ncbi:HD family phosphohydrolase [Evansella sp. AB-rgal1]|uniref:HD family phosphohydrolase n=1 Tax=Evansella sp. AB-rgal1 TaxID=3242696 RepID=UPI00359CE906
MGKRPSIDYQNWWQNIKHHRYIRFFLFVLIGVITYGLLVTNVIPETLEVEPGSISDQDIRSPITIEHKTETERLKQLAYESIGPIYTKKTQYVENQIARINEIFQTIRQVQREVSERIDEIEALEAELELIAEEDVVDSSITEEDIPNEITLEEQVERVRSIIARQTREEISDETLITLLQASPENLEAAQETTASAIYDAMNEEINMDRTEEAKNEAERKVVNSAVDSSLFRSMIELVRFGIVANYMLDDAATEEARNNAVDAVDPVMIREGQLLVEEGQMVTSETYNQLALVGLLDDHSNVYPFVGLAIIVILLISMLAYYLGDAKTSLQTNNTHLLMYVVIYTLTLVILKLISFAQISEVTGVTYIVPVAMGTMLITILLHSRVALFTAMIFSIVASVIFNGQSSGILDYSHGIYVFFSSVAGVFFLSRSNKVFRILQAGLFVGALNVLVIIAILLLRSGQFGWMEISFNLGFGFLSGFIAAVLTLGLLPFLEAAFGVLSTTKLIELSNPNHPLLRKILLEAPGTYHHSVFVANLAEGACEAVGANGLLARVGAYYHDLGKTKRPHFFIENQMKIDNPHDKISPQLSKTIIIAHPYDGVDMLKEYKMPREIIGIAEQHHGTTLLKYFYFKAMQNGEKEIPEEEFRYPGPKAQSREAAIVGIADCVEAAVRSMNKPSSAKIEALVKKIITDRLEDGQFDECDLTLKELNKIAKSICETLQGTFHSRIEYPDEVDEKIEDEKKEGDQ